MVGWEFKEWKMKIEKGSLKIKKKSRFLKKTVLSFNWKRFFCESLKKLSFKFPSVFLKLQFLGNYIVALKGKIR